jgi:choice-of-anchor B domain-containing protein
MGLICSVCSTALAIPPKSVLDRLPQATQDMLAVDALSVSDGPQMMQGTSGGFDVLNMIVRSRVTPQSFSTNTTCAVSATNVCANDVWGYVSPSGREYGILGLRVGTGVVDVTDPDAPVIVGAIPDASSIWSDMKTYQQYMYNSNESGGGIQVISMANVDPPTRQISLVRSITQNGLQTSHTLALNEESGYLYLAGSNLGGGRLVALSLLDPSNPVIVGQAVTGVYVHAAQVVSYRTGPYAGREIAFCYCGSQGLKILDVTNKANMFTMGSLVYPNTTYCHQGWLTADRRHVLINDELDEVNLPNVNTTTTYIINVEDLANPQFVRTFTNGLGTVDHNLMIRNYNTPTGLSSFVFEANYASGLRVYDINDLANVTEVGYVDSYPANNGFSMNGAWGVYSLLPSGMILLADMQAGLLVVDPSPAVPDDCALSSPPQAEAFVFPKNRYLSITPTNAGVQTAIRVVLSDLPPPFEAYEGSVRWLESPESVVDSVNPVTTFKRSRLSCDPVFHDFGSEGPITISDHEIVPGGSYQLQQVTNGCDVGIESNYSAALVVSTAVQWGDLMGEGPDDPPNGDTNFIDIAGLVDKFRNLPTAPGMAKADLSPSQPDGILDFTDISACVNAFRGFGYPYSGPISCP